MLSKEDELLEVSVVKQEESQSSGEDSLNVLSKLCEGNLILES